MKKEIKREWLKALRSGEYKQCRYALHNGVGFCCLGVLIDSCFEGYWKYSPSFEWKFLGHSGTLPGKIARQAGLNHSEWNPLAVMNDNGKKFSTIANWIEKNISDE